MITQSVSLKRKVFKAAPCVLVLWGEYFDEVAATLFVVILRQAGVAVRFVGVHGLLAAGRNGLLLQADLTLSEVKPLIDQVTCLVVPCRRAALKRLENDPRVHELFVALAHNGAKMVVHDRGIIYRSVLHSYLATDEHLVTYAQEEHLQPFVQEMAKSLIHTVMPSPACCRTPAR